MEDLGTGSISDHYRLVGDRPYLLIEFQPEEDGVDLVVSSSGLTTDETIASIREALTDILAALDGSGNS